MLLRCDLHVNGGHRRLVLASRPEETFEHMALKLSAALLFWKKDVVLDPSPKNPVLAGQEFRPDFMGLDVGGEMTLWGECGNTSLNKLDKVTRRFPRSRLLVIKAAPAEGERLRRDAAEAMSRPERLEILAWPPEAFQAWREAVADVVEAMGEADERSLNLVINEVPLAVDLLSY